MIHRTTLTNQQFTHFYPYKDYLRSRERKPEQVLTVRGSVAANGLYYILTTMPEASLVITLIKLGLPL